MSPKLVFDGDCPVCINLKNLAEKRSSKDDWVFIPYQSEDFKTAFPGLTREEAEDAIYICDENGKQFRGARAVFEIMREFPGVWGVIGSIFRLPPLIWIAEPLYRLFAKHRHRVSRFVQR